MEKLMELFRRLCFHKYAFGKYLAYHSSLLSYVHHENLFELLTI